MVVVVVVRVCSLQKKKKKKKHALYILCLSVNNTLTHTHHSQMAQQHRVSVEDIFEEGNYIRGGVPVYSNFTEE
jgi:hypothetical protein